MRGEIVWPVVVGVVLVVASFIVVTSQRQFQQQLGQMRQEIARLEGRQAPLEPLAAENDLAAESQPPISSSDTRLLRRIFLDDLREQIATEESEDSATQIIKSWFE